MGKRSKASTLPSDINIQKNQEENESTQCESETNTKKLSKKKDKVKNYLENCTDCGSHKDSNVPDTNTSTKNTTRSSNKPEDVAPQEIIAVKKAKKSKAVADASQGNDGETTFEVKNEPEVKKAKKCKVLEAPLEDVVVPVKSTKKKKPETEQSQQDEEDFKDEDIDQFCDELTEEDNVQFDNWVKLIEAKLHSPKNKKK